MPSKRTIRPQQTPSIFRPTAPEPAQDKPDRIKRTFYLMPDDITALEEMQRDAWIPGHGKPELSHLVSEAIQTLRRQRKSDREDV